MLSSNELEKIIGLAKRYCRRSEDWECFIGEAVIQCILAQKRYNQEQGTPFLYFTWPAVRGAIINQRSVEKGFKYYHKDNFKIKFCDEYSIDEFHHQEIWDKVELKLMIEKLPKNMQRILYNIYWEGFTEKEISESSNFCKSRIGQIKNDALVKLKRIYSRK